MAARGLSLAPLSDPDLSPGTDEADTLNERSKTLSQNEWRIKMLTIKPINLKIDEKLGPPKLSGMIERNIVSALIKHMRKRGFNLHSVYDGETETPVNTETEAMELIFNLDEASLRFGPSGAWHGVLLVMGNREDIISDWNYAVNDADGFDAAMNAFVHSPEMRGLYE